MSRIVNISNTAISTVPLLNSTVVLWDSTAHPGFGTTLSRRRAYHGISRAIVRIYADQIVTFKHRDLTVGSTTWRVVNNAGSGEATAINTYFERDCLFIGDDMSLIVDIVTAPTTWEVSVQLIEGERALGQ